MKIHDRLPIPEDRTSLRFGDRHVTIHAYQISVWVSVHLSGVRVSEESIPRFPALLDTGNNFGANDLDFWLDPERRHVTLQPRTWCKPLIRLLCRS
jgi:hypothetical protein